MLTEAIRNVPLGLLKAVFETPRLLEKINVKINSFLDFVDKCFGRFVHFSICIDGSVCAL